MKILVFGASGRTGQHLIAQALEQGHTVTAFTRTPSKIVISHNRLRILKGDIHDSAAVEMAVKEHDVVLCALGLNKGEPATALADGTQNIVQAMEKYGVRRIINVSAAGFSGERADFLIGKLLFWIFNNYLKKLFEAMGAQHQVLLHSKVEWITVRPVLLDEGPRKGNYRVVLAGIPSKGYRINTADVADFMLNNLSADEYLYMAPAIAY